MKKHKNGIVLLLLLLAAACFALSLLRLEEFRENKKVRIVFIPKVMDETNDFWMSMITGAKSAAREYQADLVILAPQIENDNATQEKYIDEAIKLKPDVIALSPIRYSEMTDSAWKIKKAGIKLILLDSMLDEDLAELCVSTDNIEAGIQMGSKMLDYMKEDTKIAIMSFVKASSTAIEREQGVRTGLGEYENRIETVLYSNSDYEQAYEKTKQLLEEKPEINLIAGLNLYSTVGVARAVREKDLKHKIYIVGFDNDVEGIQYLEEGIIDTLIVQKPFNMGYLGIQKSVEIAKGKKVEKIIHSETEIITVDNIYTDENQKLLFPF